ncbi:hypothetical protein [Prochlorococcus marinus]|uniref:hypothetical protein n=1 Tax=Prochlorococcus marinus TaxID=1219 RepID=UPI0022B2B875|nr:hypothetical protein [Prochlorococcus marinus]
MNQSLNSRKTKSNSEINWQIREIFSEAALTSFSYDLENKYLLAIEKKRTAAFKNVCS